MSPRELPPEQLLDEYDAAQAAPLREEILRRLREVRGLKAALAEACRRNTLVEPPGPAPPDSFLGGRAEHV